MKKILFILTISVVSILAKPCMTDIYFGNGVWNTPTQASKSTKELRKFMQINYNARLDRNKEGETYQFMPPTYNPTRGTIEDLLETFWQLKESGQISEGYFTAKWNLLTADRGPDELRKSMNRIAATNTVDVNQMYQRYKVSSLDKKNNILLVAHSQGNLFGNKIYTILTDQQKQKFRMVSVATPANSVAGGGSYVTATLDYVIAGIPNHLSANVAGVGHTFVGTYLGSSFEARTKIALHVKSAYDNLMQTTTCTEYKFTRVTMPEFGILKVDGNIAYGKDEEVGRITLDISDADWDDIEEIYRCTPSKNSTHWGGNNYIGYNWTDFNGTYNQWIPGTHISNRFTLDNSSSIKDTVLYDNQCITISLEQNGELYKMIYDMFPE